ncbi:hypothetical protein QUB68_15220 [Microcoleus sp. A006_D1]|uniref:hypothetical protein n=1 Tax=Microcoleus sp. A006_D1 TaxID=3055267 RepID=UPI002FD599C3
MILGSQHAIRPSGQCLEMSHLEADTISLAAAGEIEFCVAFWRGGLVVILSCIQSRKLG